MPAIIGAFMTAGLGHLGWRLARRCGQSPAPRDVAAGFVVVTAAVAAAVQACVLFRLEVVGVLRWFGWGLALIGAFEVARMGPLRLRTAAEYVRTWWTRVDALGKAVIAVGLPLGLALSLLALAPPTDADSLGYHLAVPLDWLLHGVGGVQPYWIHSRLVGLGESLILLGLAAGTDVFGACLQVAGLAIAVTTMVSLATSPPGKAVALLFVLGAPVLLTLVPVQKPQMLPAGALFLSLVLLLHGGGDLGRFRAWAAWVGVAFAAGSKHSFILTGAVVGFIGLWSAWRQRNLKASVLIAAVSLCLVTLPVWVRSVILYGDPISPNLEAMKSQPDAAVLEFQRFLRSYAVPEGPWGRGQAFLAAFLPSRPSEVGLVLGCGVMLLAAAMPVAGVGAWFLAAGLVAALLVGLLGQVSGRFLLEPYLWCGASVFVKPWTTFGRPQRVAASMLVVQSALVFLIACYGVARLLPGALSRDLRNEVMYRAASGFAEARWVADVLPRGAGLLSVTTRSHALMPRGYQVYETAGFVTDARRISELCALASDRGISHVMTTGPVTDPALTLLLTDSRSAAGPADVQIASRKGIGPARYRTLQLFELAGSNGCPGAAAGGGGGLHAR